VRSEKAALVSGSSSALLLARRRPRVSAGWSAARNGWLAALIGRLMPTAAWTGWVAVGTCAGLFWTGGIFWAAGIFWTAGIFGAGGIFWAGDIFGADGIFWATGIFGAGGIFWTGCVAAGGTAANGRFLVPGSCWAVRAVVVSGLSDARSSQNCSSLTPPKVSVGHNSSSTWAPLRKPTRLRGLAALSPLSADAATPSLGSVACGSPADATEPPLRPPTSAGSPKSRTGFGPVLSSARKFRVGALAPRPAFADPLPFAARRPLSVRSGLAVLWLLLPGRLSPPA
jgi:hypothetical protein